MLPIKQKMGLLEWLMIIILSFLWGGSFFFIEIGLSELPALSIVFSRIFIAAFTLLFISRILNMTFPKDKKIWGAFFIMALLNNAIPFCAIVWGQTYITSGLASILNATTPLFTIIVAHLFTNDEKIKLKNIIGILIGFIGVVIMIGVDFLRDMEGNVFAQLSILLATLSYGFAGVFGRKFAKYKIKPVVSATSQLCLSSLIIFPLMLLIDKPWTLSIPSYNVILSIIALAVFSTALAYIIYFNILSSSGATNVSLVTLIIPINAIMLGTNILGEELLNTHIFGMICISIGLLIIDGRVIRLYRDNFKVK